MSEQGWGILFVLGIAALVTIFLVVATWQSLKVEQAKAVSREAVAHDEAYRKLAEEATAAQQTIATEQQTIAVAIVELNARVAVMEKLLREVG